MYPSSLTFPFRRSFESSSPSSSACQSERLQVNRQHDHRPYLQICSYPTYQYIQRTPFGRCVTAHRWKQTLCTLLPQAALHQTISSVFGSNSMKQIGQSPSIGFLFPDVSSAEAFSFESRGALWKISRSSYSKSDGTLAQAR
jgi:hypothetical protein